MSDTTNTDTAGEEEKMAADWEAASDDGKKGDELTAEWEAMADDGDGAEDTGRVLDQDEIDSHTWARTGRGKDPALPLGPGMPVERNRDGR